jgi:acyl-CoA synthetase (NDP forming)
MVVSTTRTAQAISANFWSDSPLAAIHTMLHPRLGYPVVLKVDSAAILHKTEAGVVRLGLGDAAQVPAAFNHVMARAYAFARVRRWLASR